MSLPTREDINVFDSLDERYACEHFLGKDLSEAQRLFADNFLVYDEDLSNMGPRAFRYYVQAAIAYIESEQATDHADDVMCFAVTLESWNRNKPCELVPIAGVLASACRYIIDHWEKYDTTPVEIYNGNIKRYMKRYIKRYIKLQHTFDLMAKEAATEAHEKRNR